MPITYQSVLGEAPGRVASMLSAVVPVFNEEDGIPELHRRLKQALESTGLPYELVLVNDGSRDKTWSIIETVISIVALMGVLVLDAIV